MADVTYYFNSNAGGSEWADPGLAIDNILTNFMTTATANDTHTFNGNTAPGTDLGTITVVEMRYYCFGDGDDDLLTHPTYDGVESSDNPQFTPPAVAGWSSYINVTSLNSAPGTWTWADVVTYGDRITYRKDGKGNTMGVAKGEVRVTYTPTPDSFIPTITMC